MHVTILHQRVAGDSEPDERDVLAQLEAVREALAELGAETSTVPCTLDLRQIESELGRTRPDLVFNLVESLADRGELIATVPCLLDALGVPYTGASAEALFATSNKLLARGRMKCAGLSVAPSPDELRRGRFIVKSVWEHASRGLDAKSVVEHADVAAELVARRERFGGPFFAEAYVDGREFNVSILHGPSGPEVLPIAELVFEGYPTDVPRIVDYAAKWDADSFAYKNTRRRFLDASLEASLVERVRRSALSCWQAFELRGYARVDFRADAERIVIVDVNANPCLAPDAGFAAALQRAGVTFVRAIERIVEQALTPGTFS
jgi:D-alanine-D-alanine ligase